jgi:hypothetical protein
MGGDVNAPMLSDPPGPDALRSLGIRADETRVIETTEVWWRVHRTAGGHVLAWNAFRTYGPLLRFDPHALPKGDDPGHGRGWRFVGTPATNCVAAMGRWRRSTIFRPAVPRR